MGCSLTKDQQLETKASDGVTFKAPAQADAATQAQSPSQSAAHKSAISALYIPSHIRSRRASSLAPGPDTPSATPLRDPLHGSETGPRVLWRTTAAMFHAHARRFSSSSTADRLCDRRSETGLDHELSKQSQSQRIDSNDSAALSYADAFVSKAAHEQHQQPSLHKDSHTFDSSVNLTPQSVISALYGEDTSAHTTPSEVDQLLVHHQAGTDSQRPSLDKSSSSARTSAEYVAQFGETVAQLAASSQKLDRRHQCSSLPNLKHRIRRTLSTVAQAPHVAKQQPSARNYVPRGPYSHDPRRPYIPMPISPTWALKRKNFQQMVPHSAPSVAARIQAAEAQGAASPGQHRPAPLPSNELARQEAVDALNVMQDPPAAALHDIAACAAVAFQVPVVVITLIGDSTVWCQTQSDHTGFVTRQLCLGAWTLLTPEPDVLEISDCMTDFRSQYHPMVAKEPGIRFYAAAPIVVSSGFRIGTLAVTDMQPRQLVAQEHSLLKQFAAMAARQLELAAAAKGQAQQAYIESHAAALCNATHGYPEPTMLCDISNQQHWRILAVNSAWVQSTGICREHAEESLLWDVFYVPDIGAQPAAQMCMESAARQSTFSLHLASQLDQEDRLSIKTMDVHFRPTALHSNANSVAQSFYFATIREPKQRRGSMFRNSTDVDTALGLFRTPSGSAADLDPFSTVSLGPLLGQGGSGHVYRGTWNGATVAVKVVEAMHAREDDSDIPLKPLEAMLSIDLAHPNIIHTYKFYTRIRQGHGQQELTFVEPVSQRKVSETWLVLEYCSKGSLQDALDRGWFRSRKAVMDGSADLEAIIITATEIASAMAYLHSLDILHGDLSGNNILLACNNDDERGFTAKVADFGMARMLAQGEVVQTRAIGTITHMPPELMLEGSLSQAVDVYAFGVVLWEMYTAQRPWAGMRQAQIVHTVASLGQQLDFPYGTPSRFEDLGMACMHPDPDQRPSFTQIMAILEELTELAVEDPLAMISEGYPMHIL